MIVLLTASSMTLAALQATINAPREAFRTCLREASNKAAGEKVSADAYEAYIKANCSGELGSLKAAVVKFDIGNKMSRKASADDADSMIGDFVSSALDNYKYLTAGSAGAAKQAASAVKPPAAATPPAPTPAAQPVPPK